jgi:type I restriction enzyme S subunit
MNLGDLRALKIPVPPAPEQRRIVAKLDALFERSRKAKESLDRIPPLLERLRQSILAAAFRGNLTKEWREAHPDVAAPWTEALLEGLCDPARVITYGVIKLGDEAANGVPCLRTSNVRWLRFELDGLKKIARPLSQEFSRTILRGQEVLVNVRGTLGGVAVASEEMRGWNVSREVAVVPVDPGRVVPDFLAFWIGSKGTQNWLAGVQKGVAYTGINIADLRNLPVSLPSITEQREVVRRIRNAMKQADALEACVFKAMAQSDLEAGLLAKAFRGELVPQDPNDEPASVLLERIRAEREAAALAEPNGRRRKAG